MEAEVYNSPTTILVTSESEGDKASYLVDLCAYEVMPNVFNGSCQCRDFLYRHEPKLKNPEFMGKVFRCKHIRYARDHALDFILPVLCRADKNNPDSELP